LSTTFTTGVAGTAVGLAIPLPFALVQPETVVATVYVLALVTVILGVAAPVDHNNVPGAVVDNTELPQLFTTVTIGADGIATGAANPEPRRLVQDPEACDTVYVPPEVTVIDGVEAPVDHNKVPGAVVDNTELPQLFTTVTVGVLGTARGAATADPGALVQPETVVVTVYVLPLVTVIDGVDAPVDHNNVPDATVLKTELPQLFATVTDGELGIAIGAATADPDPLVHPETVVVTVYVFAEVTVIEGVDAPVDHNRVPVTAVLNTELPQLFTTVTTGAAGIEIGAAVPEPGALVQPTTV
jgi:hypothetical protein